jgi:heme-degrading monooxygenase HmoA
MSVLEIARFTAAPGNGDKLEQAVKVAANQLVDDPNTLKIEIYRAIEAPEQFTWLIWWTSIQAHINWRASDKMEKFLAICRPLLSAEIADGLVHHNLVVNTKG